MKTLPFLLLLASLLVLTALSATAQYDSDRAQKLGVRIGVFSPTGSPLGGKLKSTWRSIGAEYALSSDAALRPTDLVSLTVVSSDTSDAEVSSSGLLYEKRWYANRGEGSSFYLGGGAGYYLMKAKSRQFSWADITGPSGGEFGLSAVVGYRSEQSYFGEIRYSMPGKLDGIDLSGVSINVGLQTEF